MAAQHVVIVGAGFTGLVAAHCLRTAGVDATVLDKASRPGGRLATRRIGGHRIDTGVRSFDVRDEHVLQTLLSMVGSQLRVADQEQGWRLTWAGPASDLAASLAADRVAQGSLVTHLTKDGGGVGLWGSKEVVPATSVLLTMPAPQSALLLQRSGLSEPLGLDQIEYERRLVVVAELGSAPGQTVASDVFDDVACLPAGGQQWLVRAQVRPSLSAAMWEADVTDTLAQLLQSLESNIGGSSIVRADCMRWRYSTARAVQPESSSVRVPGLPVLIGGDGFGTDTDPAASVERACRSGLALAEQVLGG